MKRKKESLNYLLWALLILVFLVAIRWIDNRPSPERVGHPIACSDKFPFQDQEAEILQYGLNDVRGLASDSEGHQLFIQEADRALLIDWFDSGLAPNGGTQTETRFQMTEAHSSCSEGSCGADDPRGLAILGNSLYSADFGRGQIAARPVPLKTFPARQPNKADEAAMWWEDSRKPVQENPQFWWKPSGIAAGGETLFALEKYELPMSPSISPGVDAVSKTDVAKPTSGYELIALSRTPQAYSAETIAVNLHNSSGLTAAASIGPVIVAQRDDAEVRWPVFEKINGHWQQTRSLGAVKLDAGHATPTFLSLAVNPPWGMVFASGPGGLYVFALQDGTLLGRVMFDDPVDAVTSSGNRVFLAVGHTLASLTIRSHPIKSPTAPTATSPTARQAEPSTAGASSIPSKPNAEPPPSTSKGSEPRTRLKPAIPPKPSDGRKRTPPKAVHDCPCASAAAK
jgi:hypothetical protein